VGDRVAYTPNLPDGGFADPVNRARYDSRFLSAHWHSGRRLSIDTTIARRNFTSLRDNFRFNSFGVDASIRLPAIDRGTVTSLELSIASNRTRQLNKNSYTQIGDTLIKQVTVKSPSDLHWRASLSQNKKLTTHTSYTLFSGVGQTVSQHSGIGGLAIDASGCSYDFQFFTEGGTVDQRDRCGAVRTMKRVYPNESSIEREHSIAPQRDMQNNAWFYRVGGNLTARFRSWQTQLAFYHQRYVRDELDARIRSFGGEIIDRNNVIALQATRFVSSRLSYTAVLEYNQHQFLDDLPVLYTRLTSDRFSDDLVHLTVQFNYAFLR